MASGTERAVSPIYTMRESLDLQAKIQEAKVLGAAGARTTLIQKLALTAQPSRKQLSIMRRDVAERADSKEKSGIASLRLTGASEKEAAAKKTASAVKDVSSAKEAFSVKVESVYRETKGFAAVG